MPYDGRDDIMTGGDVTIDCFSACKAGTHGNCSYEVAGLAGCWANCPETCAECPSGKSTKNINRTTTDAECEPCKMGFASEKGDPTCSKCSAGTYAVTDVDDTTGAGVFEGATTCKDAIPGSYVPYEGSVFTITCPRGTHSGGGAEECHECPSGRSAGKGESSCAACR